MYPLYQIESLQPTALAMCAISTNPYHIEYDTLLLCYTLQSPDGYVFFIHWVMNLIQKFDIGINTVEEL